MLSLSWSARFACISVGLSLWLTAIASFGHEPTPPAEFDPAHAEKMQEGLSLFKSEVRKILIDNCVDCHGGEAVESGFDLATRKGLIRGGSHGASAVAGKSADSNVVRFIRHQQKPFMPEGSDKLPPANIAAIARWIDLGAPYDKPLVENPRDPDSWVSTIVPEKAREFWAFQPLANPQPPAVKNEAWIRNPIDRFVLAKLEEQGLTPNPPAEPRILLRRAAFDLVGLPPALEDVSGLLSHSPTLPLSHSATNDGERGRGGEEERYEAAIDTLLASPHFGERWARHWLDAARFAESHGFEQDYDRPYAYHFRDFVIEAFNQDMPFDQFVRWQLAGDEFEPENPLALKATGFLGAGVFPTQITANEVERTRYDALDDMAATMGSAMLGLSIGCARCHDHKFDPIPQADYYRILATFTTTVRSNLDVNLDPGPYKVAKAAYDKEHQPLADMLAKFEREELPARLAEWEKSDDAAAVKQSAWIVLDLVNPKSNGDATLTRLDDGSLLASGTNADSDWWTFSAKTELTNVTAIRIEALTDPSLPKSGPGRSTSGNFVLTDLKLRAKSGKTEAPAIVKLQNPRASFEQKDFPVAAAIDEQEATGWAIGGKIGEDHAAVFQLAELREGEAPAEPAPPTTLNFQLDFKKNKQHAIGRLRVSVSSQPLSGGNLATESRAIETPLTGPGVPESILKTLGTPVGKRTAKQTAALLAWYRHRDAEWQQRHTIVAEHGKQSPQPNLVKMMVCSEGVTPIRHHTQGADFFSETHFLKRGDCDQKMGVAEQGFLQVLMTTPEREKHWQATPPEGSKLSYRRRALANWVTDTEHGAGHLLARVIVNRLWHHHFGRGIVATPNDFGVQGTRPTHPELLDWLAQELIKNNWRLKPIHKLILTSATYMQSGQFDAADAKLDPENTWLWRREPQRLEAELIRDNLLAVSGTLDRTLYGPGTLDEGHTRRSIYFQVKRSKLVPMMQLFDQPEPLVSVGNRPSTTIAPQALAFLNSPHVRGYAHNFAKRLLLQYGESPAAAIQLAYLTAINRRPDETEQSSAIAFLAAQENSYTTGKKDNPRELALADFCQVLFGLNEFVYVE